MGSENTAEYSIDLDEVTVNGENGAEEMAGKIREALAGIGLTATVDYALYED